jgi:DNA-binding transcriptional LysR family regulator
MIRNIELVTLTQTLLAAGQGSFHKAGELLRVPASTISRRVRGLETLIGVKLFDRHRHGIRPTAAGEAFLKSLRRSLDELNIVLVNAATIAQGKTGWLKIGTYVSPSTGHLRAVLSKYRQSFPDVEVQYTDEERRDLMERLNAGAIDVAIVADHFRSGVHEVIPLWHEKVLVAMPESHRLANKGDLTWDDLRKEQIFLGRDPGPELRNHVVARLKASGDVPAIHQFDVGRDFSLSLVGIEPDVTLLYEADAGARHPGVIYREVTDHDRPSLVPYYACWLSHNKNPALQSFLDLLRQHQESHRRQRHAHAG